MLIGSYFDDEGELKLGDIIVGIDRKRITDAESLISELSGHQIGDVVSVVVLRDDLLVRFKVRLDAI